MTSMTNRKTGRWFGEKDGQLDICELKAFGITLTVRRYEAWALRHQLEFAELAARAGLESLIEKVFYDSNPGWHEITLIPEAYLSDIEAVKTIAKETLQQFMVNGEGLKVGGAVYLGRGWAESDPESFDVHPLAWRRAAWLAAFRAEQIDVEEFGDLFRLPQVRMWAALESEETIHQSIGNLHAFANRSKSPVLLLIGWPEDRGYWAIHPDEDSLERLEQYQSRTFRVSDQWPFEGSGYHFKENRFFAHFDNGKVPFPLPVSSD